MKEATFFTLCILHKDDCFTSGRPASVPALYTARRHRPKVMSRTGEETMTTNMADRRRAVTG